LDLTSINSPKLSFWLAYRLYTNPSSNPNYSDTLEVLVSTDCGQTFTSAYKKFSTSLVTTPAPFYTTAAFVPTTSQWRRDSVDLAPFASFNNVVIKFRSITDYENNLYLDDINIDGTTGIGEATPVSALVYPNPVSGPLTIDLNGMPVGKTVFVRIIDMTGRQVRLDMDVPCGQAHIIETDSYESGIYYIEISSNDGIQRLSFTKY